MLIKDILYQTPEMSEEKLLEIIKDYIPTMKKSTKEKIQSLYPDVDLPQAFLNEYDVIQSKQSTLSRDQRDQLTGFIGLCIIQMTKGNGGENSSTD